MVGFFYKLYLSDQNYHTNVNVRGEHYKGKLLFPMKDFFSFVTDLQSMYFMSTRFVRYNINGVLVPLFQIAHICDKNHT